MIPSVSVAVMAHPKREEYVRELAHELDRDAPVIWDERNDRWDTGRRSLLAYDPDATHHLVVQDDAIVCRDLIAGVERALEAAPPDVPVALYTGRVRPFYYHVKRQVDRARDLGATWLVGKGPWWGVAICVPTAVIPELVPWADQLRNVANYDIKVSRFFQSRDVRCWYTLPSLVDHREGASLVPGRSGRGRTAFQFIGVENSALDVQWSQEVVDLDHRSVRAQRRAEYRNAGRASARRWSDERGQLMSEDPYEGKKTVPVGGVRHAQRSVAGQPAREPDPEPEAKPKPQRAAPRSDDLTLTAQRLAEESIHEVKKQVSDNRHLAAAVLEVERESDTPRKTLISHLEGLLEDE